MGRNRITVTTDLTLNDIEVEVPLDACLESADPDDLWEALTDQETNDSIAERVVRDEELLNCVAGNMDDDQKHAMRTAWMEEGIDTDDVYLAFDSLGSEVQKRGVVNHVLETFIKTDDTAAKAVLDTLLSPDAVEDGAKAKLRQFAAECIGAIPENETILNVHTDGLADILTALRQRTDFTTAGLMRVLMEQSSAGYVVGCAMEEGLNALNKARNGQ